MLKDRQKKTKKQWLSLKKDLKEKIKLLIKKSKSIFIRWKKKGERKKNRKRKLKGSRKNGKSSKSLRKRVKGKLERSKNA